jgi:hypothetical protein
MPRETITFRMEGDDISLRTFAQTVGYLRDLLSALAQELAHGQSVQWMLQELHAGSAEITLRGSSPDPGVVDELSRAFVYVGHAYSNAQPLPYAKPVRDAAERLISVINGAVHSFTFETDDDSAVVGSATLVPPAPRIYALGELPFQPESGLLLYQSP